MECKPTAPQPHQWRRANKYLFISQPSGYHIAAAHSMGILRYESFLSSSNKKLKPNEPSYELLGIFESPQEARDACDNHKQNGTKNIAP